MTPDKDDMYWDTVLDSRPEERDECSCDPKFIEDLKTEYCETVCRRCGAIYDKDGDFVCYENIRTYQPSVCGLALPRQFNRRWTQGS